jgi:foldase protein PrsA
MRTPTSSNLLLTLGILASLMGAGHLRSVAAQEPALAKVGSESISRAQLMPHVYRYFGKIDLTDLVQRSQLRQEAQRVRVTVSDADVDARADAIRKGFGDRFKAQFESLGVTEEVWKERLRYEVLAEKISDAKWPVKEEDLVRLSVRSFRVQSEQQARMAILDVKNGANFEFLCRQQSLDPENAGLIQPDPFFRIDNPRFFRLTMDANLRPNQITPKPLREGQYYLVLRLEKRLEPSTLSPKQREDAVNRIKAYRFRGLKRSVDARFKIDYPTPIDTLQNSTPPSPEAVFARITPITKNAPTKPEEITFRALTNYAIAAYGEMALNQLIERSWLSQEARKLGVTVTDAELQDRVNELTRDPKGKGTNKDLQDALALEGISLDAWKERLRYTLLAEKVVNERNPVRPEELDRMTVRYIRVPDMAAVRQVLAAFEQGAKFDVVMKARSLDKGEGFIIPKIFFRFESPVVFDHLDKGNAPEGKPFEKPLDLNGSFAILQLEKRFDSGTLSATERRAAVRRINAGRQGALLDTYRKGYKVEKGVPLSTLIADSK